MNTTPHPSDFNRWIIINRFPFWVYIRTGRPVKEFAKSLLFTAFPAFFANRIEYLQWKESRVFSSKEYSFCNSIFWKKIWRNSYELALPITNTDATKFSITPKLAIVIHAFYPEILSEILEKIGQQHHFQIKLFVSCSLESEREVYNTLIMQPIPFNLITIPNRGRDVLPFIQMLPSIKSEGFELLLKVHTKKSNHVLKNKEWKNDIFKKLLSKNHIDRYTFLLAQNPKIGLLGPEGHILPMAMYYGINATNVRWLCKKIQLPDTLYPKIHFIAGTMFYARISALEPIMDLHLTQDDFENEEGQNDGTMAHAIERAIGASCLKMGLTIVDTTSEMNSIKCTSTLNYRFSP